MHPRWTLDRKWVPHGQEVDLTYKEVVPEGQEEGPGWTGSGSQDGQESDSRMDRKWVPE